MTASPPAPVLAIRELQTWFTANGATTRAVDGVSLEVWPGETVGIVGESGSGKTQTFLSVLGLSNGLPGVVGGSANLCGTALFERPRADEGVVGSSKDSRRRIAEHRARLEPLLGRAVALVPQDPKRALVPYWTVREHLHAARHDGPSRAPGDDEAERLLGQFGFPDPAAALRQFPDELSGGEAQRVMLAMAMVARPRILIADEPTTALDAITQVRVLRELRRVHEATGAALVLISHDLAVVAGVVRTVYVFLGGRVVERAPVSVLTDERAPHVHPYTASLRDGLRRRAKGLPLSVDDGAVSGTRLTATRGCPFAGRCERRRTLADDVRERCASTFPPQTRVADDQVVACWALGA